MSGKTSGSSGPSIGSSPSTSPATPLNAPELNFGPKAGHRDSRPTTPAGPVGELDGPKPSAPTTDDAVRVLARVRRLMLISILFTLAAVAGVIGVISYRVFNSSEKPEAPLEVQQTLPKGAKVVLTGVAQDRIIVTLERNGAIEIRAYDLKTFKSVGRLSFTSEP